MTKQRELIEEYVGRIVGVGVVYERGLIDDEVMEKDSIELMNDLLEKLGVIR